MSTRQGTGRKAFTLIELLIVVAIIAILAAIAVPNFLEAQMRAKVARTKSDLRTCATAMEAYRVDNNLPPVTGEYSASGQERGFLKWQDSAGQVHGPGRLVTSPVAYLTDIPYDVFNTLAYESQRPHGLGPPHSPPQIVSASLYYLGGGPLSFVIGFPPGRQWDIVYGGYNKKFTIMLQSVGPDLTPWLGPNARDDPFYDPTNGTLSTGDLWYVDTIGMLPQ